jgi:hypothetical protein
MPEPAGRLSSVPFTVTMMLADAAQVVDNKLYILGGGWSVTGPDPAPTAIALQIKVPWDQTNTKHALLLELLDLDGEPIMFDTPVGRQALRVENEFEVGRPPGVKPGTSIELSMAVAFAPFPLPPGGSYTWKLSIDGETHELWSLPFTTREA